MKKPEKKTKAVFILTMPRVNTWNGTWTGAGKLYAYSLTHVKYGKTLFPELQEKSYGYDFGDGWYANVKVTFMTPSEARQVMKKSDGFCGYEWMVGSICKHGKIIVEDHEGA
jgi:hypothetical protein